MRQLLHILVPLVLPFLFYGAYVWLGRRLDRYFVGAQSRGERQPPWLWLTMTAAVLVLASLITLRLYIEPQILSRPDERNSQERPAPTGFPSEPGNPR